MGAHKGRCFRDRKKKRARKLKRAEKRKAVAKLNKLTRPHIYEGMPPLGVGLAAASLLTSILGPPMRRR